MKVKTKVYVYFYGRWSKDAGNQDTISAQLGQCGRIWEGRREQYEVLRVQEFADKGYDLETIDLSKDYHIMLDEIEALPDSPSQDTRIVIVVKKLCRFVRAIGNDQSCVHKAVDLLRRKKVILFAGRTGYDFKEFKSHDFQKRWRDAVNHAQLNKYEDCEKMFFAKGDYVINYSHVRPSRAMFGYSIKRDRTLSRRDEKHYRWEVIPEEAAVINLIYRLYTHQPPFVGLPNKLWPNRCVGTPAISKLLNEGACEPGFEHLSREAFIQREKDDIDIGRRIERRTVEEIQRDITNSSATIRKVDHSTKKENKWNRDPDDHLDENLSPYWTSNTIRNILRRTAYKGMWFYLMSDGDKTRRNTERKILFSPDWAVLQKEMVPYAEENGLDLLDISDYFDYQNFESKKINYHFTTVKTPPILDDNLFDKAREIRRAKGAFLKSHIYSDARSTLQIHKKISCPSCKKPLGIYSKDGLPRYRCNRCKGDSSFSISSAVVDACVRKVIKSICSPEEAVQHSLPSSDINPDFINRIIKEKEHEIKGKEESLKKRRTNYFAVQQQLDTDEEREENTRVFEDYKAEVSATVSRIRTEIDNLMIQLNSLKQKPSHDSQEIVSWYLELSSGNSNLYSALANELIKSIYFEKAEFPSDIRDLTDSRLQLFFRRGALSFATLTEKNICNSKREFYKKFQSHEKYLIVKHAIIVEFHSGANHTFDPFSNTLLPYDLPEFYFESKDFGTRPNSDDNIQNVLAKVRSTQFSDINDLISKLKSQQSHAG